MQILEHGVKHPQYIGRCENCSCKVLCEKNEVQSNPTDPDYPFTTTCPECGETMGVERN